MRRAVYAGLLLGLFVLLLSALVVTPEPPPITAALPAAQDLHAVFRPVFSALPPETADAPCTHADARPACCLLAAVPLMAAAIAGFRDANGRILTAARYENSVYQLFRPETAGG